MNAFFAHYAGRAAVPVKELRRAFLEYMDEYAPMTNTTRILKQQFPKPSFWQQHGAVLTDDCVSFQLAASMPRLRQQRTRTLPTWSRTQHHALMDTIVQTYYAGQTVARAVLRNAYFVAMAVEEPDKAPIDPASEAGMDMFRLMFPPRYWAARGIQTEHRHGHDSCFIVPAYPEDALQADIVDEDVLSETEVIASPRRVPAAAGRLVGIGADYHQINRMLCRTERVILPPQCVIEYAPAKNTFTVQSVAGTVYLNNTLLVPGRPAKILLDYDEIKAEDAVYRVEFY
jgi:hypothetical protein